MLIGIVIVLAGAGWLLNNIGITDISIWPLIVKLWPLVIVYFGLSGLWQAMQTPPSLFMGIINVAVAAFGALLIANNYHLVDFSFGDLFSVVIPVIVIFFGLSLLFSERSLNRGTTQFAVMSGLELRHREPFSLKDQQLIALMGGGEVDLSNARLEQEEVTLSCIAIMGSWEIKIPRGLKVEFQGLTLLGGIEAFGESMGGIAAQKTVVDGEDDWPLVRIRAQSIMGGIEIKRV